MGRTRLGGRLPGTVRTGNTGVPMFHFHPLLLQAGSSGIAAVGATRETKHSECAAADHASVEHYTIARTGDGSNGDS